MRCGGFRSVQSIKPVGIVPNAIAVTSQLWPGGGSRADKTVDLQAGMSALMISPQGEVMKQLTGSVRGPAGAGRHRSRTEVRMPGFQMVD
jgi:hypothetical protein